MTTTHTVSFKPGAATMAALPPYQDYFNGPTVQEGGRWTLSDVLFGRLAQLGEALVESGARDIQITGIHWIDVYTDPPKDYPKDFIRLSLAKLHETTGVEFSAIGSGDVLDVRSESNARAAIQTLKDLGYDVSYHANQIYPNAAPQQVRFEVNPDYKINAIKTVRQWTGEGLKWCKDTVESGSIYISGGPLRVQAFKETFEPFVKWQGNATPLQTFTLPKTIKDKEALAAHLEALAVLIRNMDV